MRISTCTIATAIVGLGLTALLLRADAGQALKVDFSGDMVGAEPKSFLSVVGIWRIEAEGNKKVLAVDGSQWKEGQTAAGIADKARALYADRYAEFLDRVQAYAYFPYTVAKDVDDFRDGEISIPLRAACCAPAMPAYSSQLTRTRVMCLAMLVSAGHRT